MNNDVDYINSKEEAEKAISGIEKSITQHEAEIRRIEFILRNDFETNASGDDKLIKELETRKSLIAYMQDSADFIKNLNIGVENILEKKNKSSQDKSSK